jgi:hypothetical protein
MEYYFNELDPVSFQRLINVILLARMGEDARFLPLRGADGGRDAEVIQDDPCIEISVSEPPSTLVPSPPRSTPLARARTGHYIFQVKYHRTTDNRPTDLRRAVLTDFARELRQNILAKRRTSRPSFFFLVTNVPGSKDSMARVDGVRESLLSGTQNLHADIWWQEQVIAYLDLFPSVWAAFPQLFAGGKVPPISGMTTDSDARKARILRLAMNQQYARDRTVKFRQIDLAKDLCKLFVDLDVDQDFTSRFRDDPNFPSGFPLNGDPLFRDLAIFIKTPLHFGALSLLLSESPGKNRILLEGGPGQGKSTITQMAAQIYRARLLGVQDMEVEGRWVGPTKLRIPIRIELRRFAEKLAQSEAASLDSHIAELLGIDVGGESLTVNELHDLIEGSPVLLILDGLDEVANDELRDSVLDRIGETIERFTAGLAVDLRVILTSRPPAIAGRQSKLGDYLRLTLAALGPGRITEYLQRWLDVQLPDVSERQRVRSSFESRRGEPHFEALVKNPMQLSILLHFIYLKGDAFPSRRSDLYRDYFQIVIDRDVEKSTDLRRDRDIVEALHRFLGFEVHSLTEAQLIDGSLLRADLLKRVESWLEERGEGKAKAQQLFKLGEERLGLIVVLRGSAGTARYGFEIQPVREYFAAAHINDDMAADAHELFQRMVRRPYWREVALFLGGLRRPNEKADLVARARDLDGDPRLGWRQDGRDLVLQLMREGSLSQPRYVFSEALDFVMDLLDAEVIPLQREPDGLVTILPKLISLALSENILQRLRVLLERYKTSDDEDQVSRLLAVAFQVLDARELRNVILTFASKAPETIARVRLSFPMTYGLPLERIVGEAKFWAGVPPEVWGAQLWETGLRFPAVVRLEIPPDVHRCLLGEFALRGEGRFDQVALNREHFMTRSAVWQLLAWVDAIRICSREYFRPGRSAGTLRKLISQITVGKLSFSGLDESLASAVDSLVCSARQVVESFAAADQKDIKEALVAYAEVIMHCLQQPMITGCLAARCFFGLGDLYYAVPRLAIRELELAKLDSVRAAVGEIVGRGSLRTLSSRLRRSILMTGFSTGVIPLAIRVKAGEPPVPLIELLSPIVAGHSWEGIDFLRQIPFSTNLLRPLVDRYSHDMVSVLKVVSQLKWRDVGQGPSLRTGSVQRILSIARKTSDEEILRGALIAVSTSRFSKLAGDSLILKMMAAEGGKCLVGRLVFGDNLKAFKTGEATGSVREDLATKIFRDPRDYSFAIVRAAASFSATYGQYKPGALIEERAPPKDSVNVP